MGNNSAKYIYFAEFFGNRSSKTARYLVYLICVSICSHQRSFIMDVREQITALREQLRYHNEKY